MKTTISTPEGPRTVPDWAACHCVTTHRPMYIHPYPFALPDGTELWLCPATYHQACLLLKLYETLDGPPKNSSKFNYFVRSLLRYYWQQILQARSEVGPIQLEDADKPYLNIDIYEILKKTPL